MTSTPFNLQFLGSGNAWTKPPANFHTNVLVSCNQNSWLIDCGTLCPLALHHLGIPLRNIDAAFISHLHGDHVLGLEELLLHRLFCEHRTIDLFLPAGLFTEHSGIEGADIWQNCLRASLETPDVSSHPPRMLSLSDYASVHKLIPGSPSNIFGLTVDIFPVEHIPMRPCYGIMLDHRVAYTSDCTFSRPRLEELFNKGVSTVFHDVCFTCPGIGCVHTAFDDLATLPRDMAERIILMHYADDLQDTHIRRAIDMGFRFAHQGEIFSF